MAATLVPEDIDADTREGRRLPPSPRAAVIITLVVRLVSLLGQHIHSRIVGEGGFNAFPYGGLDDGRYYYTTAEQLADGITPDYVLNTFPRVLAVFMNLGIRNLLALKLISFAVSSIAVVMIALLAWHLSIGMRLAARRWTVIVASVLGSLFPNHVFWSTNSLMRDGWILAFALVAIWAFSSAGKTVLPRGRWAIGLIALIAATSFRPYVLPIYLAALVSSRFDYLNPMRRLKAQVAPVVLRLTMVATAFIGVCLMVAPALTDITGFNILAWRTQEQLSGKGSSMGLRFDGVDSLVVVPYYLLSFVSNAIGPMPFQIESANQLLALVEYPFFIIIAVGLFKATYSTRLLRFCALFGLYWILLLGLWNDVLGNATRNRIMAWPILAIAASPAIAQFLSDKFNPLESAGVKTHRRRLNRRTEQRRANSSDAALSDSSEAELSDSRQQSEQKTLVPVSAGPPAADSVSRVSDSDVPVSAVAVSTLDLELADWFQIDEEGRMQMRRGDNDRRLAERRDLDGGFEAPGDNHAASHESSDVPVDDDGDPEQSSASSDPSSDEPADDQDDGGEAESDYPLFAPRSRTDSGTSVLKVSRSGGSGRKEQ